MLFWNDEDQGDVFVMKEVTAAILVHNGRMLIARRKTGDLLAHFWEFPGGKVEPGETREDCLRREMQEEFLIEVEVHTLLGQSEYHYEHGAIRLWAFWARWVAGEMQPLVHEEIRWVEAGELKNYTFAPADLPFVERLSNLKPEFFAHKKMGDQSETSPHLQP